MEFLEITEDTKALPGEYIYHIPTKQIVLCGSFNRSQNQIRVLSRGRLFTDIIVNFKKIKLSKKEHRENRSTSCKGCRK